MDLRRKEKGALGFHVKYLMISVLNTREPFHVCICNTTNKVWYTLKEIHDVPTKIERVHKCIQENEIQNTSK